MFAAKKNQYKHGTLFFATVDLQKGGLAWYYILVEPLKAPIFSKLLKGERGFKFSDYGEIVARGWGKEPPESVKQRMREEYGMQD